jgi:hypothetical protein
MLNFGGHGVTALPVAVHEKSALAEPFSLWPKIALVCQRKVITLIVMTQLPTTL